MHTLLQEKIKREIGDKYYPELVSIGPCIIDVVLFDPAPYSENPLYGFFFGVLPDEPVHEVIRILTSDYDRARAEPDSHERLFSLVFLYSKQYPAEYIRLLPKTLDVTLWQSKETHGQALQPTLNAFGLQISHDFGIDDLTSLVSWNLDVKRASDSFLAEDIDFDHFVKLAVSQSLVFETDQIVAIPRLPSFEKGELKWKAVVVIYYQKGRQDNLARYTHLADSILHEIVSLLFKIQQTRTAIAAIMARNMDHLIGSHIETAITHHMPDLRSMIHEIIQEEGYGLIRNSDNLPDSFFDDDFWETSHKDAMARIRDARARIDGIARQLNLEYANYRLKRMDLIARFSTEWISWSVGMSFFNQVMLSFIRNGILQHFLGHGEGIRLVDFDYRIFYPNPACEKCLQHNCDSHRVRVLLEDEDSEPGFYTLLLSSFKDFNVYYSIPTTDYVLIRGGDVGAHAFHILLENILRNSAKHGKFSSSQKIALNVWAIHDNAVSVLKQLGFQPVRSLREDDAQQGAKLRLEDGFWQVVEREEQDSWFILISSSADYKDVDSSTWDLAMHIDSLLCRPLVKESGVQDAQAWGMKEKKICAAYLAGLDPSDTNSTNPDYIWAGTIPWRDTLTSHSHLTYCLRIPKARFLLYVPQSSTVEDK